MTGAAISGLTAGRRLRTPGAVRLWAVSSPSRTAPGAVRWHLPVRRPAATRARELRDGDERFDGLGVRKAVGHVGTVLTDAVVGIDARDTVAVDFALECVDEDPLLGRVGANAVLAVSRPPRWPARTRRVCRCGASSRATGPGCQCPW